MYLYLCDKYDTKLDPTGIWLPGEEPGPGERALIVRENIPKQQDEIRTSFKDGHFNVKDFMKIASRSDEVKSCLYRFEVPQKEFMQKAKSSDASPYALVAALMFRMVSKMMPERKLPIQAKLAHNFRQEAGVPNSTCDYLRQIYVRYPDSLIDAPLKKLCTITRGQMILQMDPDLSIVDAHKILDRLEAVEAQPTLQEKIKYCAEHPGLSLETKGTFIVSYTGQTDWGSLLPYIETEEAATDGHLVMEILSIGDKFCLCLEQMLKGDEYKNAFAEELKKEGIPFTVSEQIDKGLPFTEMPG